MKTARWYQIVDGMAYIYDAPYSSQSQSVSIVNSTDLAYYRRTFDLRQLWGTAP